MSTTAEPRQPADIDYPSLERSLRSSRTFFSSLFTVITAAMAVMAMFPLFSVLFMLIYKGGGKVVSAGLSLFTEVPPAAGMEGGGIGNALLGTLIIVAIATAISVPVGILGAVFLAEFGPTSRTATAVRFCAKVLTGLPSVLAGLV